MTDEMEAAVNRVEKENRPIEGRIVDPADPTENGKYAVYELIERDESGEPDEETGEYPVKERFTFRAEQPTEGQLAFLMASMGRGQTTSQRIAALLNFLDAVLEPEGQEYLASRMLSRDNEIGFEEIERVFSKFTEEWFGRPTQ